MKKDADEAIEKHKKAEDEHNEKKKKAKELEKVLKKSKNETATLKKAEDDLSKDLKKEEEKITGTEDQEKAHIMKVKIFPLKTQIKQVNAHMKLFEDGFINLLWFHGRYFTHL